MQVGQEVKVQHARKGNFRIKITEIDGDMITGTITEGTATYLTEENRTKGDSIRIDTSRSFIKVIE
jgi:hypothetical protein